MPLPREGFLSISLFGGRHNLKPQLEVRFCFRGPGGSKTTSEGPVWSVGGHLKEWRVPTMGQKLGIPFLAEAAQHESEVTAM